MEILRLLLKESGAERNKLLLFSVLSGVSGVLVLALLNGATAAAAEGHSRLPMAVMFLCAVGISVLSQKFVWRTAARATEDIVHGIRLRIMQKAAGCGLENLEAIGRTQLYSAISQHTYTISMSAPPIIISLGCVVIVACTIAYMAWLSLLAFALTALAVGFGIYYSVARSRETNQHIDASIMNEHRVYGTLSELLDGFKEVKLHRPRQDELLAIGDQLSQDARASRVATNAVVASGFIGTQTALYFLLAILVFVLPQLSLEAYPQTVVKLTAAGLFMIGPVSSIISIMPMFTYAESSLQAIHRTEALLDENQEAIRDEVSPRLPFKSLALDGIRYAYKDADGRGFSIGPMSFEIKANEVIFITGGNGSGKTTMLRVLLGLYTPASGRLMVNGRGVAREDLASHRALFSTVLADYHLFSRNYGLRNIAVEEAEQLLERMGLAGKTGFRDGQFDTVNLSTGQRKRLALIVAILEDRPVLVFDEWAADQDPVFRRIFYQEIIPELKAAGRTVIAVTHDEKYFGHCDRHLHMVEGEITELEAGGGFADASH